MVVLKRKLFRKVHSPIRAVMMPLRGRTSTQVTQMISEPFNVAKIVNGQPETMYRYDRPEDVHQYHELPVMTGVNIIKSEAMSVRMGTPSTPEPQSASPPHLNIKIPELRATTVEGKTFNPFAQTHHSVRSPLILTAAAQATLNETRAWKIHADRARKAYTRLSEVVREVEDRNRQLEDENTQLQTKNRQIEEEIQKLLVSQAIQSQQKFVADHFKMLFEKETKKVESLRKELKTARTHIAEESKKVEMAEKMVQLALEVADPSIGHAEAVEFNNLNRSWSQQSARSNESWSHSDDAKFSVAELPILFSLSSPAMFVDDDIVDNKNISWTAKQILEGFKSDGRSDLELADDNPSGLGSPVLTELSASFESDPEEQVPIEPTELPTVADSSTELPTISKSPAEFRFSFKLPIRPSSAYNIAANTTLNRNVAEVMLTDLAAKDQKKRRSSGRVFQGNELMSFRLPQTLPRAIRE